MGQLLSASTSPTSAGGRGFGRSWRQQHLMALIPAGTSETATSMSILGVPFEGSQMILIIPLELHTPSGSSAEIFVGARELGPLSPGSRFSSTRDDWNGLQRGWRAGTVTE
ncbi:hypothetical protein CC2G_007096 [Coprinopsis cinerea AmutBmut pab1-1]|nr:hypothetical protein CC2G_007096 [Coprinopsis cinerea AmutBmut pab1-1]